MGANQAYHGDRFCLHFMVEIRKLKQDVAQIEVQNVIVVQWSNQGNVDRDLLR